MRNRPGRLTVGAADRSSSHRPDVFEKNDIHVHLPEGATPKEGRARASPSRRRGYVRTHIGEGDGRDDGRDHARGEVLAIGGLKEKCCRHRGEIKTGLIPDEKQESLARSDNVRPARDLPVKGIDQFSRRARACAESLDAPTRRRCRSDDKSSNTVVTH